MRIKNVLPALLAIFGAFIFLASCEEDLGTIGSEIIGDQNINATLDDTKTVISYSRKLLPVQSNGLPIYQLGSYNDPVYGRTTANLLTQLTISQNQTDPIFNNGVVVDSVILYMPFFSEGTTDDDGNISYKLDSVYGADPIDISIFESNYFLRDFDPATGFEEIQNYYTNQGSTFDAFKGELIHTIPNFLISSEGFTIVTIPEPDDAGVQPDTITTNLGPGIRVELPPQYWKEKIIDVQGGPQLINNNNFREYLRGLYFKVAGTGDNLSKFNLENARIDMYYSSYNPLNMGDELAEQIDNRSITFEFNAISVNSIETEYTTEIGDNLMNPNTVDGEDRLYLKGGDGIMTILELFGPDNDGNGVADELDQMRTEKWLINEANLIFYVDKDAVTGGSKEPERILIYDVENNTALIDYANDTTSSAEDPLDSYTTHLGRLERGNDGSGDFYKIRITNHLSNLIHRDSTNISLGLVVSQNVGVPTFQDLENALAPGVTQIPASSVISHEGTVLHGNTSINGARRLKLQIYYTESN
ncbi:MAG: DUF4270 domain-containing protein [Patiriisocius sp.]|uniref:DUF4270 domain-containing protein n=1 Tax=Patiriisocius sp. TaxID=2822396 RepID=UPI003EF0F9AA